jgi:hypothetical protein
MRNINCLCAEACVIRVIAVYMDRTAAVELRYCSLHAVAEQLVARGLFPCAPLQPSLAVCVNMLEFVLALFVRSAPNERAWVRALATYLAPRGYLFKSEVRSASLGLPF